MHVYFKTIKLDEPLRPRMIYFEKHGVNAWGGEETWISQVKISAHHRSWIFLLVQGVRAKTWDQMFLTLYSQKAVITKILIQLCSRLFNVECSPRSMTFKLRRTFQGSGQMMIRSSKNKCWSGKIASSTHDDRADYSTIRIPFLIDSLMRQSARQE